VISRSRSVGSDGGARLHPRALRLHGETVAGSEVRVADDRQRRHGFLIGARVPPRVCTGPDTLVR
jgi:hypothetical protein